MSRTETIDQSKRAFTRLAMSFGLAAAVSPLAGLMLPESAMAGPVMPLKLFNPHTGDKFDIQLFAGEHWNEAGVLACNWVMRDWREKMTVQCDKKLFAALYVIQVKFGINDPICVNSGFRSPKTNAMLRKNSISRNGGVSWETPAVNSQHCKARAVDFKVPGVAPREIAKFVEAMGIGGTGNYPTFTHMDTGSVRQWGPRP